MLMTLSPQALAAALASGEPLVVLDARQHHTDPTAPRRMWLEARIPGAAHLDMLTTLATPARPDGIGGRNPMPTPAAFLAGLNGAGARRGMRLVAYDGSMEGVAARVWWLARELGIDVEVLEGGLAAWRAAGGAVASGEPDTVPEMGDLRCPDGIDPELPIGSDGSRTVSADELLEPDPSRVLVDVRAPSRYRGDEEPLDPIGGHIPGSINIPNLDADGRPPAAPVLDGLVRHDGEVVASCGSGVSACLLLLRLAEAGRDDAKLYPGSYSEWLALGHPHATGDS
jgi:thiosulfate/3-mercaptopyruvate sulfurtransferase